MDSRRVRVEFIRFTLLVTLTVALISVAVRHHGSDHQTAASGPPQTAQHQPTPSGGASAPGAASSSGASSGATAGPGARSGTAPATGSGSAGSTGQTGSTGAAGSNGGTASGGSGSGQQVATLPRTGSAEVAVLAAAALLLIGGGSLTLVATGGARPSVSRRRI